MQSEKNWSIALKMLILAAAALDLWSLATEGTQEFQIRLNGEDRTVPLSAERCYFEDRMVPLSAERCYLEDRTVPLSAERCYLEDSLC